MSSGRQPVKNTPDNCHLLTTFTHTQRTNAAVKTMDDLTDTWPLTVSGETTSELIDNYLPILITLHYIRTIYSGLSQDNYKDHCGE